MFQIHPLELKIKIVTIFFLSFNLVSCVSARQGDALQTAIVSTVFPPPPDTSTNLNDRIVTFSGVDGKPVTVTVHSPSNTRSVILSPAAKLTGQSDSSYLAGLIAQAISSHASVLKIPQATYTITPSTATAAHLAIQNASDLTIDGQGSALVFTGAQNAGIEISHSKRLALKNFSLDWNMRFASPGKIFSDTSCPDGKSHLYVEVDAQYPIFGNGVDPIYQQATAIGAFDTTQRKWGSFNQEVYFNQLQANGGQRFYPCTSSFDNRLAAVTTVIVRHLIGGAAVHVIGANTADVTMDSLILYSGGIGFLISGVDRGLWIHNSIVARKPDFLLGSNELPRLISTTAGASHIFDIVGDVIFENNNFSLHGDDGFNLHGEFYPVSAVTTGSGFQIQLSGNSTYSTGDTLSFLDPDTMEVQGSAKILAISFDKASLTSTFTLDQIPSSTVSGSLAFDLTREPRRYYIHSNIFSGNRERAMLVKGQDGLIDSNTILNTSGPGMLLVSGGSFPEGYAAANTIIRGNILSGVNFSQAGASGNLYDMGAITAAVVSTTQKILTHSELIQNLLMEDNTISNTNGIAALISGASHVTLSNNIVQNTNQASPVGSQGPLSGSISVLDASNVTISGNTRLGASTQGIYVDASSTSGISPQLNY